MNKLDKIENVNILAKTIQYALCNASSEPYFIEIQLIRPKFKFHKK